MYLVAPMEKFSLFENIQQKCSMSWETSSKYPLLTTWYAASLPGTASQAKHLTRELPIYFSLLQNGVTKEALRELGVSGRSGSFLYITKDQQFILKTLTAQESWFLRRILRPYYDVSSAIHLSSNENSQCIWLTDWMNY
jgi:hypothetical protein